MRLMYLYDSSFVRQMHADRVAALRADYAQRVDVNSLERDFAQSAPERMNRSIRLAWVSSLGMRATWLLAVFVPIGIAAVGIKLGVDA